MPSGNVMQCAFCGHTTDEDDVLTCSRCGSDLSEPHHHADDLTDIAELVEDEVTQPAGEVLQCPSCAQNNPTSNDYCENCGSPLGVVTRVYKIDPNDDGNDVDWMVFGIETKTMGRESELLRLEHTFRAVVDEVRSCVCILTGSSGLGKSRLVREFNSDLDSKFPSSLMVIGKCRETDHLPYAPIARLVRKRFYIPELEVPRLCRQRLLDAVTSIMGTSNAPEVAHLVAYLIGLPFPESPFYSDLEVDESVAHRVEERAGQALARLLEADSQHNPLILVIEEAQFATEETVALIRKIATQLRNSPIMFLLLSTPEFVEQRPEVLEGGFVTESIELTPLSDEDIRGLLSNILQRLDHIPDKLHDLVCQRALGNPLIVEEIVKILIGEGVIDTRPQPWQLHLAKLDAVELPAEFEGMVKARIDTLSPEERDCLEMASVIGNAFWLGAVLALSRENNKLEDDEWQVDDRAARLTDLLEVLRRKDMIRPHADSLFKGEAEFVFKHGVERDLIFGAIKEERRKALHIRCAQWYELHGPLDRFAEVMARHWEQGGNLSQAAYRYVQSANFARTRYFNRKAISGYEKAVKYLPRQDLLTRIEAHHNLGSTYELVGKIEEALEQYETLLKISWQVNAKAKGGMALNKIGRGHRALGQLNDALATFRRALTLFQQANDLRGIASTLDDIGKVYFIRGEYDDSFKHYRAALELRRQLKDSRSIALSLHHIGSLKLGLGSFKEALSYYRESLEMRKQSGDRQGVADTLNNLGIVCLEKGELQQALRLWEEALSIAQEIGYRILEGILLNNIGETALSMGALKTAEASLKDAAEISQECADLRLLCDVQRNLGTLHLRNARYDEAVGALMASLHIARDMESKLLEGLALKSLGELYAQTLFDETRKEEDVEKKADDSFLKAIELLTEVGNEGELGRCHSSYGNFLLEQGGIIQGKKQLELAKEIFARLEMKRVLKKTEQTIGEL